MKAIVMIGVLAVLPALHAQRAVQPEPISSLKVEFDPKGGAPIGFPSPVITQLPICLSEDSCVVDFAPVIQNVRDRSHQLVAHFDLTGRSRAIDPAAIDNLYYVQVFSSTPIADGTAVVVSAAESGSGEAGSLRLVPKPPTEPKDHSRLKPGFYLCFFDRDGKPESVHMLNARYKPAKIAYLGGDQIVLLLFDTIEEKPILAIVNRDAQIVRILDDQGNALTNGSDLMKGSGMKINEHGPEYFRQVLMAGALTGWQIGYAGKRLLLLQPGINAIIWSISPGGEIQRVKLKMPPGVTASTLVSSDRAWLVRSFTLASDTGLLLEFDPETGRVVRRIDTKGVPPTSVLFASNGSYYAIWWGTSNHASILKSQ